MSRASRSRATAWLRRDKSNNRIQVVDRAQFVTELRAQSTGGGILAGSFGVLMPRIVWDVALSNDPAALLFVADGMNKKVRVPAVTRSSRPARWKRRPYPGQSSSSMRRHRSQALYTGGASR